MRKNFIIFIILSMLFSCGGASQKNNSAENSENNSETTDKNVDDSDNPDNVLHKALSFKIKSMDPVISGNDGAGNQLVGYFTERLFNFDYFNPTYTLIPQLADGMPTLSDDGLTYTFKVKPGILYYDPEGKVFPKQDREVKSKDFVLSILRLADKSLDGKGFWTLDGSIKGLNDWRDKSQNGGDYENLPEGIKIIDDYTFSLTLTKPNPQLLMAFRTSFFNPLPKEFLDYYKGNLRDRMIGTGAYYIDPKESIPDSRYVLKRNPNYRRPIIDNPLAPVELKGKKLPLNNGIVVDVVEEDSTAWLMFKKGDLDIAKPDINSFSSVIQDGEIVDSEIQESSHLFKTVYMSLSYYVFNFKDPVWGPILNGENGVKIRKAFAYGIDQEADIKLIKNGLGVLAKGLLPPGMDGYDSNVADPEYLKYDVDKAKQLLAEAGYPDGKGLPQLKILQYQDSTSQQYWELMLPKLQKIGFNVKLDIVDFQTASQMMTEKNYNVAAAVWGADYPDAQNFFQLLYGSGKNNESGYDNPKFNELYEKATIMQPSPERTELYKQMDQIVRDEVPFVCNVNNVGIDVVHNWVKNYKVVLFSYGSSIYESVDTKLKKQFLGN